LRSEQRPVMNRGFGFDPEIDTGLYATAGYKKEPRRAVQVFSLNQGSKGEQAGFLCRPPAGGVALEP